MSLYVMSGVLVDSEIPLPELPHARSGRADCTVRTGRIHEPLGDWVHDWNLPDGRCWLSCRRRTADYLLRFPGLADFSVAHAGSSIVIDRHPETEWSTLRHLLLDQVFPQALSARGGLVLHGAAIRVGRRAIAILGTTGSGKSTLAASFWESGVPVLCDDCLFIRAASGGPGVVPSYPGVRLWPDTVSRLALSGRAIGPVAHYTEKMRVQAEDALTFDGNLVPLARIYVLAPDEASKPGHDVRIEPLEGGAALIELVKHAHRLDVTDRRLLAGEFERLTWLGERCPTRTLAYPRDFARLSDVRAAILEDVGSG